MQSSNAGFSKKITTVFPLILLVGGVILTAWGLSQLSWPQALPWTKWAFVQYISFIGAGAVLVVSGSLWSKRHPYFVCVVIAISLAVLSGMLWPLIVVFWFGLASAVLGRAVNVALGLTVKSDSWLMHLLVGAGMYGTAVGLLAHFPVNYPGVYGLALALPVMLGWRNTGQGFQIILDIFAENNLKRSKIDWLSISTATVALVYIVVALMPEVGFDALWMHMFVPAHMSIRHQWGFDASTYVWAVIPMLGDWMFSIGYMLGGETASRMINVGFIFLLAWLVRDLALWAGGSILGARWAVLIFLSSPLTFTAGSTLFIESVWAVFLVSGLLAVLRACSQEGSPKNDLIIAALLLGLAATAKAITLTILPIPLLVLVMRYKAWFGAIGWLRLFMYVGLFIAVGSIPYVTAWWLTGNPVFPFFNGIFKSQYFPEVNFDSSSIFGKGVTWDILYRITFESGKYLEAVSGASGFQWLLLFIPAAVLLLAGKHARGIILLIAGSLIVVLVFHSVSYLRYVFPAWAILAAAIGVAMSSVLVTCGHIKKGWVVVAALAVSLNLLFFSAGAPYTDFPLQTTFDKSNRTRYLSSRLPIRNAVELVNNLNVGGEPVAVFSPPLTAGLAADALYSDWTNKVFEREITLAGSERDIANLLLNRGVVYVILDSSWKGGADKIEQIKKATQSIAEYNSVSVRRIKPEYMFSTELLIEPDFVSINAWALSPATKYDANAGVILASVSALASQSVPVIPNRRYLISIVARCATEPAPGRVQINWIGAGGGFVNADIKTFGCANTWSEHTMEVIAPAGAATGIVYVTGHTAVPLEFKRASLRQ